MDKPDLPGHNAHLAPGMSQVIEAGQKYTIKADDGGELELEGRDRPWVVEFLTAMDNFITAGAKLGDANEHTLRLGAEMHNKWLTMPDDLRKLLPSSRGLGIRL